MGGKPLNDSTVISEFLDEFFPANAKLLPAEPYDRAIARLAIDHINKAVVPAFFRLLQAQPSEPEKQATALAELNDALAQVSKEAKGPYFFGEIFSLVDVAIAPWAVRDFVVRDFRGFIREEVTGWSDWAAALERRQSVIDTTSVILPPYIFTEVTELIDHLRVRKNTSSSTAPSFEMNLTAWPARLHPGARQYLSRPWTPFSYVS